MLLASCSLLFARAAIAVTFGISAVTKATSARDFADVLPSFGVPIQLRRAVAAVAIATEAAASVTVLGGGWILTTGLAIAAVLLLTFTGALLRVLARGDLVDCHCFGHSKRPVSQMEVYRNLGLLTLVVIGLALVGSRSATEGASTMVLAPSSPGLLPMAAVAGIAGAAFALIWSRLSDVAMFFRPDGS
jgi:hypothetical protein